MDQIPISVVMPKQEGMVGPELQHHVVEPETEEVTVGELRSRVDASDELQAVYFSVHRDREKFHAEHPNDDVLISEVVEPDADRWILLYQPFSAEDIVGNPLDAHPETSSM